LLILDVKSLQQYWDGWVAVFGMQPATQANSASCPTWDQKLVSAKVRWCSAAGK